MPVASTHAQQDVPTCCGNTLARVKLGSGVDLSPSAHSGSPK